MGQIFRKEEDAFKLLLQLDTVRGHHSTGVMSIDESGDMDFRKSLGTPWELFKRSNWFEFFTKRHHKVLLGHNRYATVGKQTDENAHPFNHGAITGVHNGTIRNKFTLKDHTTIEVDSSALYNTIDIEGVEQTLARVNGAFALVWHNAEENTLNFIRNDERPLWLAHSKTGKTLFWASEEWMLHVALSKNDIEYEKPWSLPVGELWTFKIPQKGDVKYESVINPEVRKIPFYVPPPVTSYNGYGGYYQRNNTTNNYGKSNVTPLRRTTTSSTSLADYSGKVVYFEVVGAREQGKQEYIKCLTTSGHPIELRVYADSKTKLYKRLINSSKYFTARVRGFTDDIVHGRYLKVDPRTITESMFEDDDIPFEEAPKDTPKTVTGPKGNAIPLETFFQLTTRGCNWCGKHPTPADADDIQWISGHEFLCFECYSELSENPSFPNLVN